MRGAIARGILWVLGILALAALPSCEAQLQGEAASLLAVEGQQALGVAGWSIVAACAACVILAVEARRDAARRQRRLLKSPDLARSLRPGSWMAGVLVRLRLGAPGQGEKGKKQPSGRIPPGPRC